MENMVEETSLDKTKRRQNLVEYLEVIELSVDK